MINNKNQGPNLRLPHHQSLIILLTLLPKILHKRPTLLTVLTQPNLLKPKQLNLNPHQASQHAINKHIQIKLIREIQRLSLLHFLIGFECSHIGACFLVYLLHLVCFYFAYVSERVVYFDEVGCCFFGLGLGFWLGLDGLFVLCVHIYLIFN